MRKQLLQLLFLALCSTVMAQTKDDYSTSGSSTSKAGLLDPSRLSINHSLSFGMTSYSGSSGLKSQSLYSTMIQYQFHAPVTVNLNFGLPIHSTISSAQNLNVKNVQSLEYFKNMPIDFSLKWQPLENMSIQLHMERNTYNNYYYGNSYYYPGWYQRSMFGPDENDIRR